MHILNTIKTYATTAYDIFYNHEINPKQQTFKNIRTNSDNKLTFDLIVLGTEQSGKTSFVKNLTSEYIIDEDFVCVARYKKIYYDGLLDTEIDVNIWDTSSEKSYNNIIKFYHKACKIIFIIYKCSTLLKELANEFSCEDNYYINRIIVLINNVSKTNGCMKLDNVYGSTHHFMIDVTQRKAVETIFNIIYPQSDVVRASEILIG